jgi:hypothetical protein
MAIRVQQMGVRVPDSERYDQGDVMTVDVQGVLTVWGHARGQDDDERDVVAVWAAGTWARADRE